eukprot:48088-Pelagomonas_calceolata.AAC.2
MMKDLCVDSKLQRKIQESAQRGPSAHGTQCAAPRLDFWQSEPCKHKQARTHASKGASPRRGEHASEEEEGSVESEEGDGSSSNSSSSNEDGSSSEDRVAAVMRKGVGVRTGMAAVMRNARRRMAALKRKVLQKPPYEQVGFCGLRPFRHSTCKPYAGVDLEWHPVTPDVGKITTEGPRCCQDVRASKGTISSFFKPKQQQQQPASKQEGSAGKRERQDEKVGSDAKRSKP